jgi:hypothetical protein
MSEHLTAERISAVLDEPWSDMEAEAHLESCESCRGEYERFSRMRMALSALGELEPPPGQWEIIEERLNVSPYLPPTDVVPIGQSGGWRRLRTWPVQAAAAFALFAGGLVAGVQLTDGGFGDRLAGDPDRLPVAVQPAAFQPGVALDPEDAYYAALTDLDALRSPIRTVDLEHEDGSLNPVATAQALARLNALIMATQAAVERSPGDPVANGMLFQLMEERAAVATRIQESTRLTSVRDC